MTYRERREAKVERLNAWAARREAKSRAEWERSHQMADAIPFGQPILKGHYSEGRDTRYRARIAATTDKAIADQRKAEEMRSKAGNIGAALDSSIYDDDPDAIPQLEKRIAEAEAARDRITAYNKTARKNFRTGANGGKGDQSLLDERQRGLLAQVRRVGQAREGDAFPGYATQNLGGGITRDRQRLERLRAREPAPEPAPAPPPPPAPPPSSSAWAARRARRAPAATERERRSSMAAAGREVAELHEEALGGFDAGRFTMRAPPPLERQAERHGGGYRSRTAEDWDWFYALSRAEQARLRSGWLSKDRNGQSPDEIAERISMRDWLEHTRRADMARALATGRHIQRDRYGGLDPRSLVTTDPEEARHPSSSGVEFFTDKRGIVHPIRATYEHAGGRNLVRGPRTEQPDEDF